MLQKQRVLQKEDLLNELKGKRIFLVCGKSFLKTQVYKELEECSDTLILFNDFVPNPDISSVKKGIELFHKSEAEMILAVGGGSAMDVAKGVKGYLERVGEDIDITRPVKKNDIPLWAIPTTAGSGSESTQFAVIYKDGVKLSVADVNLLPEAIGLYPELMETLPLYQRKATMLDALGHAIESYWSVKSTGESREIAGKAIRYVMKYYQGYLDNTKEGNQGMMMASNLAGQAIHLTQTTAGHAMAYKLTTLFGVSHGHAVALCLKELWPYMLEHMNKTTDLRGEEHLRKMFEEISEAIGGTDVVEGCLIFNKLVQSLELIVPDIEGYEDELADSVNIERLSNHPVKLEREVIKDLYERMKR